MNKLLRRTGIALSAVVGLLIVASVAIYGLSERILRHTYEVPSVAITIPTDPESIQEGRRLATIRGCFGGCHGKEAGGDVLFDDPKIARIVAPDLTRAVRRYSDSQLAVIIRNGVRPDGRSVIVMPSAAFTGVSNADLGRILAFLKSLPASSGPGPSISVGPLGRIGLVTGQLKVEAELVARAASPPAAKPQEGELGRYLARTVCAECHGTSLRGDSNPDFTSPDLRVVAAYSPDTFTRLLRSGVAVGERQLRVMSPRARNNLVRLNDAEISALYSYLQTLPGPGT